MHGLEQIRDRSLGEYEETLCYPLRSRALPDASDVAFVRSLPLVQLVLTGRSGSLLVESYFDGHPELIHIPTNFTYFPFVARTPDLESLRPDDLVRKFFSTYDFRFFLDSHFNEHVVGRLGPAMKTRVVVDPAVFVPALMSCLGDKPTDAAGFFYALSTAYAWCTDQDIRGCKAVFHHLHHGDWLWPAALADRHSVSNATFNSRDLLMPTKLLVTVRDPTDIVRSLPTFVKSYFGDDFPNARNIHETYLRLMCQDWQRHDLIRASGIDHVFVPIESVRTDPGGEVRRMANWIGIDAEAPSLQTSSLFGQLWWGVNSSAPLNGPQAVRKERRPPSWEDMDEPYILAAIGNRVEAFGYETLPNMSPAVARAIAANLGDCAITPRFKYEPNLAAVAEMRQRFLAWAVDWSSSPPHAADRPAAA